MVSELRFSMILLKLLFRDMDDQSLKSRMGNSASDLIRLFLTQLIAMILANLKFLSNHQMQRR